MIVLGMVGHGDHSDRSSARTSLDAPEHVTALYDESDKVMERLTIMTVTQPLGIAPLSWGEPIALWLYLKR